jgi:hypothetical protein
MSDLTIGVNNQIDAQKASNCPSAWFAPASSQHGLASGALLQTVTSAETVFTIELHIVSGIQSGLYTTTSSPASITPLMFYSEQEFVFSFLNIYNALEQNKKTCTTANGIFSLENFRGMLLKETSNGIVKLLSPFYVLERAKELNYV